MNVVLSGTNYVVSTRVTNTDSYDIVWTDGTDTYYERLTREGRQCLKILESLGYKIVFDSRNEDVYSALPILAYAKIYMDWYFPSAYANSASYAAIQALLNRDADMTPEVTMLDIQNIFGWATYVNFDSDYLVSAWDNPVAPNSGIPHCKRKFISSYTHY